VSYDRRVPRLTRAQTQARTRAQLIRTARELFLRDGYFATSLEKVADEAGYSKGAVYSNFRNKDELCLAAIDEIRGEQAARIAAAVTSATSFEERLAAFEHWAESAIGDEGWSNLEIEFGSQVRRDPALRAAFAERGAAIRAVIAQVIVAGTEELGTDLPMPADELATALLSLGVGLGLQRAIDHSIPVRTLTNVIRVLAGLAPR
jgi:AcrR family transcriptional regulator